MRERSDPLARLVARTVSVKKVRRRGRLSFGIMYGIRLLDILCLSEAPRCVAVCRKIDSVRVLPGAALYNFFLRVYGLVVRLLRGESWSGDPGPAQSARMRAIYGIRNFNHPTIVV